LLSRPPSAIARLIVPVVVDAINCQARWSFTHIGEKVLEAVKPTFADSDASPTVMFEKAFVWVAASRPHVHPRFMRSVASPIYGMTVSEATLQPFHHFMM
jgi:hypothetical protein